MVSRVRLPVQVNGTPQQSGHILRSSCVAWLDVCAGMRCGGGLSSVVDKLSNHMWSLFKTSGLHCDEVLRSRLPALAPFVVPVGVLSSSLEPIYFS